MKIKAYVLLILGCLCFMFIGLGYMVSYIDNSTFTFFNIESRLILVALLIVIPFLGYFMIKKGLKILSNN
jgi:uncharacterized membrane protein